MKTLEEFKIKHSNLIDKGSITFNRNSVMIKDANKHSGVFFKAPDEIALPRMDLIRLGYKYNGRKFLKP